MDLGRDGIQDQIKSCILDTKHVTKSDRGKLAQVIREFTNYKLDILGLSEVRWTGSGRLNDNSISLLYSGHDQHHMRGVGILMNSYSLKYQLLSCDSNWVEPSK